MEKYAAKKDANADAAVTAITAPSSSHGVGQIWAASNAANTPITPPIAADRRESCIRSSMAQLLEPYLYKSKDWPREVFDGQR